MSKASLVEYANVSNLVGVLVGEKLATLHQLQTVYSLEDAFNLLEILTVQNYNQWAVRDHEETKRG
jgi:hypothetical protein